MEQSYREYQIYKTQLIPFTFKSIEDEFAQELLDLWNSRNMKGSVYTAYLYSLPVGFILLQDTSRKLKTIRGTWINERFRRQGLGEALLKLVQSECEHESVDILVNITKGAEGFYEKNGFEIVGHRDDFDMNIGLWIFLGSQEN